MKTRISLREQVTFQCSGKAPGELLSEPLRVIFPIHKLVLALRECFSLFQNTERMGKEVEKKSRTQRSYPTKQSHRPITKTPKEIIGP